MYNKIIYCNLSFHALLFEMLTSAERFEYLTQILNIKSILPPSTSTIEEDWHYE